MENDNTVDLLQIKIENAKKNLSDDTLNAIAAVDWKEAIMRMREKKGYNFEQLGDLELETELLLCGLSAPEDYPRELEKRMGISRAAANELVNEMNELVFKKIREELIKNAERKKIFQARSMVEPEQSPVRGREGSQRPSASNGMQEVDTSILKSTGIEVVKEANTNGENNINANEVEKREDILEKVENPDSVSGGVHPILQQKILGSVQMPIVKTDYSIENITPSNSKVATPIENKIPKTDPYRELPE